MIHPWPAFLCQTVDNGFKWKHFQDLPTQPLKIYITPNASGRKEHQKIEKDVNSWSKNGLKNLMEFESKAWLTKSQKAIASLFLLGVWILKHWG